MVSQRAVSQYQQVNTSAATEGASPHKLIQMLMQGCLQRIAEAKGSLRRNDVSAKCRAISHAHNIVAGLRASLNKDVPAELPKQLDALYEYMQRRLLEANMHNDELALDEVAGLMRKVKEGWDGIEPKVAQG